MQKDTENANFRCTAGKKYISIVELYYFVYFIIIKNVYLNR